MMAQNLFPSESEADAEGERMKQQALKENDEKKDRKPVEHALREAFC